MTRCSPPSGCPAAFATLSEDGQASADGLAVAERGMVGLFDIVTVPAARRRGARVRRRSSPRSSPGGDPRARRGPDLQAVAATNAPAVALDEKFGFGEAYRYHYRVRAVA